MSIFRWYTRRLWIYAAVPSFLTQIRQASQGRQDGSDEREEQDSWQALKLAAEAWEAEHALEVLR